MPVVFEQRRLIKPTRVGDMDNRSPECAYSDPKSEAGHPSHKPPFGETKRRVLVHGGPGPMQSDHFQPSTICAEVLLHS
jgi:hypothetical protein